MAYLCRCLDGAEFADLGFERLVFLAGLFEVGAESLNFVCVVISVGDRKCFGTLCYLRVECCPPSAG